MMEIEYLEMDAIQIAKMRIHIGNVVEEVSLVQISVLMCVEMERIIIHLRTNVMTITYSVVMGATQLALLKLVTFAQEAQMLHETFALKYVGMDFILVNTNVTMAIC